MVFTTDNSIFLLAILLIAGVFTTKFSSRFGLPSLVIYIIAGMILSWYIFFDNAYVTQLFGILALIIILFEGGMQAKWKHVKQVVWPSVSLATIGVFITTVVIGIFAKLILDVSWLEGLLIGSIVGSTDAAAVFAALGNSNIKQRLSSTLEAESGTNDPMAMFLTLTLIELIQTHEANWVFLVGKLVVEMGLGLLIGFLIGKGTVRIINNINLDSSGLYPVLAIGLAILTYSATALLGGSGLLAVYVMALFVGNSDITYRHTIFRFNEGFAWMMQILMFILLGLLVFPKQLLSIMWEGLLLAFILMLIARPLGVFISLMFSKFNMREKTLISWAGLKGAVPIVLATYPLLANLPNAQLFFNVVFFVVLLSALIQGSTISNLAGWLGLSGNPPVSTHSLEFLSTGKSRSEIIRIPITDSSKVIGKEIHTLDLPENMLITAIIRDDDIVTPKGNTEIRMGDLLYLIVPRKRKQLLKDIFYNPEPESRSAFE